MRAWITLLSTPNYLPGVAGLAASLQEVGTALPLVVALGAGMDRDIERTLARMPGVSKVLRLDGSASAGVKRNGEGHYWDRTFEKLEIFGLEEFSKLVYLDSDMLVLAPMDELFDAPHMAAVDAGRFVESGWIRLNSGLMVIVPDKALPQRIAGCFDAAAREAAKAGRSALGDQDLINSYYADWPRAGAHLDQGYNVFFEQLEAYLRSGQYALPDTRAPGASHPIKIVHFTGPHKPWMPRGRLRNVMDGLGGRLGPGQKQVLRTYLRFLRQASA